MPPRGHRLLQSMIGGSCLFIGRDVLLNLFLGPQKIQAALFDWLLQLFLKVSSADRKRPQNRLTNPDWNRRFVTRIGLKPNETKPPMSGALPPDLHQPIPIDFRPASGCLHHDPKPLASLLKV